MSERSHRSVFIPLFQRGWHTRAVLEGVSEFIKPDAIHIASLPDEISALEKVSSDWSTAALVFHDEEEFFGSGELSKRSLCDQIASLPEFYQPGWFYQQMMKLGCQQAIPELSDWTLIWDSDLVPLAGWPDRIGDVPAFALLQHNSKGNAQIVATWAEWIRKFAGVEPVIDDSGTFVPHHMWFPRTALDGLLSQIQKHRPGRPWQYALIDTLKIHNTFSEFWIVASWLAARFPDCFAYHPYDVAGCTTERFFDDGRGKFTRAFKAWYQNSTSKELPEYPSYRQLRDFVSANYIGTEDPMPSSLSLEASTRHIMKDEANRHLEETRSRWLVRPGDAEKMGIALD